MFRTRTLLTLVATSLALVALNTLRPGIAESHVARSPEQQAASPPQAATVVPVGGRIQAANACYVRLQDLPPADFGGPGRFGMAAGFNWNTGVLAFAGGAAKSSNKMTITYHEMYGIKLDSPYATWNPIMYDGNSGYTREIKKGCRETISVSLAENLWASVFGKDGCDNGRFDKVGKSGGDIKLISIGDTADPGGVGFVPNSGVQQLVLDLAAGNGRLSRHFATWDWTRGRIVLGMGAFNATRETSTQTDVYQALLVGNRFQLSRMDPMGEGPVRRVGTCGAYAYDPVLGLDGVVMIGGVEGGPPNTGQRAFNEVWWLDFTQRQDGDWKNITSRVTNQREFGARYDGACAYDPDSKMFYSWMGRADAKIPQGASYSSGIWRVDLSQLADPDAPLTWERLAPDNQTGLRGRTYIPSIWDPANKRILVLGGSLSQVDEAQDVWAIYPDTTDVACETIDPYGPYLPVNPTPMPPPLPTLARPPAPDLIPRPCPTLETRVPSSVISNAIGNPEKVSGWGQLLNPSSPAGPNNPYRVWLALENPTRPYNPVYNTVVFKPGCP